jgi:ADP-dependent NAD(P)H-hydrate dehydratase / NAD(P)H-hydrate epimerase
MVLIDPLDPLRSNLPLVGVNRTCALEDQGKKRWSGRSLMQRAADQVTRLALAVAPHSKIIWVAVGPGNNGGDGLAVAVQMLKHGKQVGITLYGADPTRFPIDARGSWEAAQKADIPIWPGPPTNLQSTDLVIDGLLGMGQNRAPDIAIQKGIQALNCAPCPVLSIDVPTGLDADTGRRFGVCVVKATHTLSLISLKPGLFTGEGRDCVGTVWWDDLGLQGPEKPDAWLIGQADSALVTLNLPRPHASHKGSFGNVLVIGGAPTMTGAAGLAAQAALATGSGRVWVHLPKQEPHPPLPRLELMAHEDPEDWLTHFTNQGVVIAGCGGGDLIQAQLPLLLEQARHLVLDADALNAISANTHLQEELRKRHDRGQWTVLTPHPLEAARLLCVSVQKIQASRLLAAQHLAEKFEACVVLKGSGSLITAPATIPWLNPSGDASLASAGTGDVLAGWLGGTWATNLSSIHHLQDLQKCVAGSVFQHGAAAQRLAVRVARAQDLIESLWCLE